MRLKNNFELRNVCGENVLIPCGKGGVDLNVLVASLVDNYEVSESVAENDVKGFIDKLIDNNIATV